MISELRHALFFPCLATGVFLAVALYLRAYRLYNLTIHDRIPYLQKPKLSEMTEMLDPDHDTDFREVLPPRRFRDLQRRRIGSALEFIRQVTRNASCLRGLGWYELRRSILLSRYRDLRLISHKLLMSAFYCQVLGCRLQMKLYFWLLRMAVVPMVAPPDFDALVESGSGNLIFLYRRARRAALRLARSYGDHVYSRMAEVL
ncbi:MAG TPA: hypothetical protein VFK06_17900 [Candidatus Angelobacter sp.]|nr:hypothetical protein [Candidatus Angelobacter sp.]